MKLTTILKKLNEGRPTDVTKLGIPLPADLPLDIKGEPLFLVLRPKGSWSPSSDKPHPDLKRVKRNGYNHPAWPSKETLDFYEKYSLYGTPNTKIDVYGESRGGFMAALIKASKKNDYMKWAKKLGDAKFQGKDGDSVQAFREFFRTFQAMDGGSFRDYNEMYGKKPDIKGGGFQFADTGWFNVTMHEPTPDSKLWKRFGPKTKKYPDGAWVLATR